MYMSLNNGRAARELLAAYNANTLFSKKLGGAIATDDAYAVQFDLLTLREAAGEALAGWKVGLTSVAMQRQQGVHEPCLGHLLVSGQRPAPATFDFDSLHGPGFENELCVLLGKPLEGADVSLADVTHAIESIAPALEIIERRSALGADFPLAIAGNAQQHAYVTGAFIPFRGDVDLAGVEAVVSINGVEQELATGAEVLGTPLESIRWLAGKLAGFGRRLEAGTLVMSGSFTRQYNIAKGDRVKTIFGPFGAATAQFK